LDKVAIEINHYKNKEVLSMVSKNQKHFILFILLWLFLPITSHAQLSSWNQTTVKSAFLKFIASVTSPSSKDFLKKEDRVAVFDFDGTIFAEYPIYSQVRYCYSRLNELSQTHKEIKSSAIYNTMTKESESSFAKSNHETLEKFWATCVSNQDTTTIYSSVLKWMEQTAHELLNRKYSELYYLPMKEVIDYLHKKDFKVYIVSGSMSVFLRGYVKKALGIEPENVLSSETKTELITVNNRLEANLVPEFSLMNDKEQKALKIERTLGRRPVVAFGNSDGDVAMLTYTKFSDTAKGFAALVHHDDAKREFAYDVKSTVGALEKGLAEAKTRGWHVISMKNDWKTIFVNQK